MSEKVRSDYPQLDLVVTMWLVPQGGDWRAATRTFIRCSGELNKVIIQEQRKAQELNELNQSNPTEPTRIVGAVYRADTFTEPRS